MVGNEAELLRRYFSDPPGIAGLGRPVLIATPLASGFSTREIAFLPVEVRVKTESGLASAKTKGILDTGADMTCVPKAIIMALKAQPTGKTQVATPNGLSELFTYAVDLRIDRLELSSVHVIGIDFEHVLLGRESLKGFTVVIDPGGGVSVYEAPKPGETESLSGGAL